MCNVKFLREGNTEWLPMPPYAIHSELDVVVWFKPRPPNEELDDWWPNGVEFVGRLELKNGKHYPVNDQIPGFLPEQIEAWRPTDTPKFMEWLNQHPNGGLSDEQVNDYYST
jgi:hypothetical protein